RAAQKYSCSYGSGATGGLARTAVERSEIRDGLPPNPGFHYRYRGSTLARLPTRQYVLAMLSFDDTALARLMIGATAVAHARRGRRRGAVKGCAGLRAR